MVSSLQLSELTGPDEYLKTLLSLDPHISKVCAALALTKPSPSTHRPYSLILCAHKHAHICSHAHTHMHGTVLIYHAYGCVHVCELHGRDLIYHLTSIYIYIALLVIRVCEGYGPVC